MFAAQQSMCADAAQEELGAGKAITRHSVPAELRLLDTDGPAERGYGLDP